MGLNYFSRVGCHARTGRIRAVFPARYMKSTAVNLSAAPRGVSIIGGASVMHSSSLDEGEDTVPTTRRGR